MPRVEMIRRISPLRHYAMPHGACIIIARFRRDTVTFRYAFQRHTLSRSTP